MCAWMPCWNLTHRRGTEKNTVGRARCRSRAKVSQALGEEDVHAGGELAVLDERALGHVGQRQVAEHARVGADA